MRNRNAFFIEKREANNSDLPTRNHTLSEASRQTGTNTKLFAYYSHTNIFHLSSSKLCFLSINLSWIVALGLSRSFMFVLLCIVTYVTYVYFVVLFCLNCLYAWFNRFFILYIGHIRKCVRMVVQVSYLYTLCCEALFVRFVWSCLSFSVKNIVIYSVFLGSFCLFMPVDSFVHIK